MQLFINILLGVVVAFALWAVICAIVVARMKCIDKKTWHGFMIAVASEIGPFAKFYQISNTCDYWTALVFAPIGIAIGIVLIIIALVLYAIVVCCKVLLRLVWFSMNGEWAYLSKDLTEMFTESLDQKTRKLGSGEIKPRKSLAVYAIVGWVLYLLASVDYAPIAGNVTSTIVGINWVGCLVYLLVAVAFIVAIVALVYAYKSIKKSWGSTIVKAWEIFHGKVCYHLPLKEEVSTPSHK